MVEREKRRKGKKGKKVEEGDWEKKDKERGRPRRMIGKEKRKGERENAEVGMGGREGGCGVEKRIE